MEEFSHKEKLDWHVTIANQEQLLETYGDYFEEIKTESQSFFLQRKPRTRTFPGYRYVVTPSGLVRIKGLSSVIWGIQKENLDILGQINAFAAEEGRKKITNSEYQEIEIDSHSVQTELAPYGNAPVTEEVCEDLDRAYQYEKSDVE